MGNMNCTGNLSSKNLTTNTISNQTLPLNSHRHKEQLYESSSLPRLKFKGNAFNNFKPDP